MLCSSLLEQGQSTCVDHIQKRLVAAPLLPAGNLYGVFIVAHFVDAFGPIIQIGPSQEEQYRCPVIKNSPRWKHFAAYNHSLVSQRRWHVFARCQVSREGCSGEREFHTSAGPWRPRIYTILVHPAERENFLPSCLFKTQKNVSPKVYLPHCPSLNACV